LTDGPITLTPLADSRGVEIGGRASYGKVLQD
jgi:hypothetical protein